MKIPHLTSTAYYLLSDRLFRWREPAAGCVTDMSLELFWIKWSQTLLIVTSPTRLSSDK